MVAIVQADAEYLARVPVQGAVLHGDRVELDRRLLGVGQDASVNALQDQRVQIPGPGFAQVGIDRCHGHDARRGDDRGLFPSVPVDGAETHNASRFLLC